MMSRYIIFHFILFSVTFPALSQTAQNSDLATSIRNEKIEELEKTLTPSNINFSMEGVGSPLVIAIKSNSPTVVEFLLKKGANVNYIFQSRTPLMFAVLQQNVSIVKLLIKAGAVINARDSMGSTALMLASENPSLKVVKILIKSGASLNIRNKGGMSARDFAVRSDNKAIALYLRNVFERHLPDYFDGPYVSYRNKRKAEVTYFKNDSLHQRMEVVKKLFPVKEMKNEFTGLGIDKKRYPFATTFERPATELTQIKKLLIIGDVHGQYDTLRLFLQSNKVIDENLHWSFGTGTVVFIGDIFDRGEKVTEALWLIYSLEREAAHAGGMVHLLLGNHELMVLQEDERFVSEKYYYLFKNLKRSYSKSYSRKTLMGKWIRSKNTMLKIDSLLFVHGGIHPNILQYGASIDSTNTLINKYINSKKKSGLEDNAYLKFLLSYNGPFWFRGLVERSDGTVSEQEINQILTSYKVKHIIVGHTFKPSIEIFYEGKVISTDVPFYLPDGYPMQALLLEDNKFVILNSKGERKGFNL